MNDYILGLLYGDGHFLVKEGYELFMFTTTHKEIADKVTTALKNNGFKYSAFRREFGKGHTYEGWEILEIIECYDKSFHRLLKDNHFDSDISSKRIKLSGDFLRGYLETSGTFFKSIQRGNEFWRIALSGKQQDIDYLKEQLEILLNIKMTNVVRRKEREHLGIISESFRVNIQNREGIAKIVEYIQDEEVSEYLGQKIIAFNHFHASTPFNMKRKIFKHYKNAVGFMAKELDITIKGIRGGGGVKGFKPVYLWNNDEIVLCFAGWEKAYKWICLEFEKETGMIPPKVEDMNV